ncbi:MAG: helix-turn-helix domain-containing protein [Mariniphaga sp.]
MYLKIEGITNETPITFLTVGQLLSVLNSKSEDKDSKPVKIQIPEIFGLDTCCELTGYSKPTIYSKTSKNEIPHFKRNSKLLFRKLDIIEWMTSNPIETKEEFCRNIDSKLVKKRR